MTVPPSIVRQLKDLQAWSERAGAPIALFDYAGLIGTSDLRRGRLPYPSR